MVKLTPKAKNDSIGPVIGDRLKISVTSPPVDGKANKHLVKYLSKKLKTAKTNLIIIQGETKREKKILILNQKIEDIREKLNL